MIYYREHKGGLKESLKTLKKFKDIGAFFVATRKEVDKNEKYVNFNYYNINTKTLDVSLCIDYKINLNRTCTCCPFFTGEKCHGHNDYWGNEAPISNI